MSERTPWTSIVNDPRFRAELSGDHSPSRLYKMFTTQGGIHVPCILHYPPSRSHGPYETGGCTIQFSTVMDIMPTILELAGVHHPAQGGQKGQFKGRTVEPMRGRSWCPWLNGEDKRIHQDGQVHGWELHGRAALRIGDWKMISIGEPIELLPSQVRLARLYMLRRDIAPPYGKGGWELFDLAKDPGETRDLAEAEPRQLEKMIKGWEEYVRQTGVIWAPRHPSQEEKDEMGDTRAWMKATGFPF